MRRVITGLDEHGRSTVLLDGPAPVAFLVDENTQLSKIDEITADPTPDSCQPGWRIASRDAE